MDINISQLETNDDLALLNFLYKLFDNLFYIKSEEDLENDDEMKEDEYSNEKEESWESEEEDIDIINKNENNIYNNKLIDMAKLYYSQNSKKNVFNDLIPKKRQNMDFDNKYIKTIYDISNKKDNDIEEDIRKKKKPQKRGNI